MTARIASLFLLAAFFTSPANAKDKGKNKSSSLPEYVLRATTVVVVIHPDAGEPIGQPTANSNARENVEKALMEWGRLRLLPDGQEADLVIAVRTGSGKFAQPTIKGGPVDNRAGEIQPIDGGVRIGAQHGQPTYPNSPANTPQDTSPHVSKEIGPSEDMFEVYRGNVQDPLDSPPVWRYVAKDCLRAPKVQAVDEFRKALAEAEKPPIPRKP